MKSPITALVLLASLCVPFQASAQDFKQAVQEAASRWDQTFNKGDAAALAKLYTENAVVAPAGGQPVTGRENIQQFWANAIKAGFGEHKIEIRGAEASGDMGYAYGRWQAMAPGDGGQKKHVEGNWVNVMQRQGEQWHTALHSWN